METQTDTIVDGEQTADSIPVDDVGTDDGALLALFGGNPIDTDEGGSTAPAGADTDNAEANPDAAPGEPAPEGDGQTEPADPEQTQAAADTSAIDEFLKLPREDQEALFQHMLEKAKGLEGEQEIPAAPTEDEVRAAQAAQQQQAIVEQYQQIAKLYRPLGEDDDTTDPDFMNQYLNARDAATMNAIPQMMVPVMARQVSMALSTAVPAMVAVALDPSLKGRENDLAQLAGKYLGQNPQASTADILEFIKGGIQQRVQAETRDKRVAPILAKLSAGGKLQADAAKPASSQRGISRNVAANVTPQQKAEPSPMELLAKYMQG